MTRPSFYQDRLDEANLIGEPRIINSCDIQIRSQSLWYNCMIQTNIENIGFGKKLGKYEKYICPRRYLIN